MKIGRIVGKPKAVKSHGHPQPSLGKYPGRFRNYAPEPFFLIRNGQEIVPRPVEIPGSE